MAKKAAIESPEKPQRIRGLAGCGKTVILAMKAAYLHACNEELKIAVTFQSRSLYQQFERLIEKFYFEHKKDDPDPAFLRVRHAWGSLSEIGLYSEMCSSMGLAPISWSAAASRFGSDSAFDGVCEEALKYAKSVTALPIYDYVLIDEAQDFPLSFFKLVYYFTKESKRIVWAYDELQNLGSFTMLPPEDLFGSDETGGPLVSLQNEDGMPEQDIMLPICYRNPPWILSLALALGLGIYRSDGLVKMFPEPSFWKNIGYIPTVGRLELGGQVTLKRDDSRVPQYFSDLLNSEDGIIGKCFNSQLEEGEWVANNIHTSINEGELEHSDILIVFPNAYTLQSDSAYVMHSLRRQGIPCHIVGKGTSRDVIFQESSVAITHIYRAKGNEAPLVYVMNSNYAYSGIDLGKKRNALFTAITRAKAWVRITGVGVNMSLLLEEIEKMRVNNFQLTFKYPTRKELESLDNAYKDKSDDERQALYENFSKVKMVKKMLDDGEISLEDLPPDIRNIFS